MLRPQLLPVRSAITQRMHNKDLLGIGVGLGLCHLGNGEGLKIERSTKGKNKERQSERMHGSPELEPRNDFVSCIKKAVITLQTICTF